MFVGHCAFEDGSWHNRNRWRGSGPFATIPIKHGAKCINEAEFINDRWKKKHLRSIELNYSKRPYFDFYFGLIRYIIVNSENLAFLNKALIDAICKWLQIKTEIVDSTAFNLEYSTKNGMLAAMCKATKCDQYLSNEGSRDYVDEDWLWEHNVIHRWQRFKHPTYDQGRYFFEPNFSVIDLLFNMGPDASRIVQEAGYVD